MNDKNSHSYLGILNSMKRSEMNLHTVNAFLLIALGDLNKLINFDSLEKGLEKPGVRA